MAPSCVGVNSEIHIGRYSNFEPFIIEKDASFSGALLALANHHVRHYYVRCSGKVLISSGMRALFSGALILNKPQENNANIIPPTC
eukprot:scaffold287235_cov29-Prasinocladus_malaysianus.AAC.1